MMDLRAAAQTRRYHTKQTIGHQTVAEHSYYVAMLCIEMCEGNPSIELLKAAMYHDLAEAETGDTPATAKWTSRPLKEALLRMEDHFNRKHGLEVELTERETLMLKWADCLELGFYCVDQMMLGNRHMKVIYENITEFMERSLPPLIEAEGVYDRLRSQYRVATQ